MSEIGVGWWERTVSWEEGAPHEGQGRQEVVVVKDVRLDDLAAGRERGVDVHNLLRWGGRGGGGGGDRGGRGERMA